MTDRKHRARVATRGLMLFAALMLLMGGWRGAVAAPTAQEAANGGLWDMGIGARTEGAEYPRHTYGAHFTVTTEDGDYIGDCTLGAIETSVPWHNCRVDVPSDRISLVWEDLDSIPAGYAPVENPIAFDPTTYETGPHNIGAVFNNVPINNVPINGSASSSTSETSDVAIMTTENGQPAYDACYVLVDYSNEGCDENRDGRVMFADIPWGTYTVRQTADLGSGRRVEDFTIQVRGNVSSAGWEAFSATIVSSSGSSSDPEASGQSGAVDIALITRDPEDGHLLTGACYVLVDYSNEGCDENGDGQVTFADIPFGTYTVQQTQTPAGYPTINDYNINVEPTGYMEGPSFGVPLGFVVRQAPDQNAPDTRNVSVVLIDMVTHEKVVADVCVELVGASNVGCDDGLADGQIDFLDVPAGGPYELRFTNLPAGYEVGTVGGPLSLSIDAEPGTSANVFAFALLASPGSGSAGAISGAGSGAGSDNTITGTSAGASSTSGSSGSSSSAEATILMTFRACPEGFDPDTDDFYANCTIPLDAPDASVIFWGGDGQGGMNITGLDRQYNGAYIYTAGPLTMNIELSGLAPVVRDAYQVVGSDGVNGDIYTFNLADGETREVFIFYYSSLATSDPEGGTTISGQGEFDEMVGEWIGKRRDVMLNADGTGVIEYSEDAFGNGLTYAVIVEPDTSPVAATIVDVTPHGDIDLSQYPTVGHTVTLELQAFPDGDLLVVDLNHDEWVLRVCSGDDGDNVQNACY